MLKEEGFQFPAYKAYFLDFLRILVFLILVLICLKPQLVDLNSKVSLEGIDIILDLDVSGSMSCFDDLKDQRSRIEIVKKEALKFNQRRVNDQIGAVIFGLHSITLCPLTSDKEVLNQFINDLELGFINPGGTSLGASLVNCCNRLKDSKAKSKIIVLLTDGEPTFGDLPIETGLEMAKKLGIKIYTVGIGSEKGGYFKDQFGSVFREPRQKLNKKLLEKIALETNGQFFLAKNAKDMKEIYKKIDQLETSKFETDAYSNFFELFSYLIFSALVMILIYLFLSVFIWFGV